MGLAEDGFEDTNWVLRCSGRWWRNLSTSILSSTFAGARADTSSPVPALYHRRPVRLGEITQRYDSPFGIVAARSHGDANTEESTTEGGPLNRHGPDAENLKHMPQNHSQLWPVRIVAQAIT